MGEVSQWSNVASSGYQSTQAAPDGSPEGHSVAQTNNIMRETMAAVRRAFEDQGWFDYGEAPTFVDTDTFTVDDTFEAKYTVGRRVRASQGVDGTDYGTITSTSSGGGTLTVNLQMDTGNALTANITAVAIGTDPEAASLTPVGTVSPFAGSSAPVGWLLCDGTAYDGSSGTAYEALFGVIGNTYGGATAADFEVPDITGRVVAGKEASATRLTAAGGGVDGATLGDAAGAETHQLTEAELPTHNHTLEARNQDADSASPSGNVLASGTGTTGENMWQDGALTSTARSDSIGDTGSDTAHANVQPTIVLNYIIKF